MPYRRSCLGHCPAPPVARCCLVSIVTESAGTDVVVTITNHSNGTVSNAHVTSNAYDGSGQVVDSDDRVVPPLPPSESHIFAWNPQGAETADACVTSFDIDLNERDPATARPCDRSAVTQDARARRNTPRGVGCALPICSARVLLD